jgi:hypothetical protein
MGFLDYQDFEYREKDHGDSVPIRGIMVEFGNKGR